MRLDLKRTKFLSSNGMRFSPRMKQRAKLRLQSCLEVKVLLTIYNRSSNLFRKRADISIEELAFLRVSLPSALA